ncbi:VWA domain-containing protein [Bryobacter aggregatus]|uniref:VWA domain-containing protein n=1 Tax=Bryobacter aggregatus TaxID=360054 RepID=UPI00068FB1C3|nr:VWA domain-containing protein [Bryobacter aggregatus]
MHLFNRRLFLLAAPLAIAPLRAQDDPVFKSDTRLVILNATVVDNKGNLVTDMKQSAFKVYENNVEQPIKIFRREDVPVSLGVIVDNSGSMRLRRNKVEIAAMQMVKASNQQDEVFVVNFNDDAFLDVDFTGEIKKMEEGLTRIDARGGTAMYDAISMSLDHVKRKGKRDKKVLMLITDGADTASKISLEKVISLAHSTDVVIYAIALLSEEVPREAKRAKRALEMITKETGGLCFFPKTLEEVDALALEVAKDIRNQYVIGYTPTVQELDGTFRTIRVAATGPNRPTVRTRSGYYAGPQKAAPKATQNSLLDPK